MASEDMDSLTFGAPRFLRHLMDPSSRKVPVMEFEVAKVLLVTLICLHTLFIPCLDNYVVSDFGGAKSYYGSIH